MAGQIRIDTDAVAQIATNIETLNKQLQEELINSQATIKNLANTWEGEASQATISAFDEFSGKYFQSYYDVIDQYVKFLRSNVEAGYIQVENANTSLADAFK